MVVEGFIFESCTLASLLFENTGGFAFLVITDGFPLIDKIGRKAVKYFCN
jgi:hypothetical protein